MSFYALMTVFWAVLWGSAVGLFIWELGGRTPAVVPLVVIGSLSMVVCVAFWRIFKDPG